MTAGGIQTGIGLLASPHFLGFQQFKPGSEKLSPVTCHLFYGAATIAMELAAVLETTSESSWPAVVVSKV